MKDLVYGVSGLAIYDTWFWWLALDLMLIEGTWNKILEQRDMKSWVNLVMPW